MFLAHGFSLNLDANLVSVCVSTFSCPTHFHVFAIGMCMSHMNNVYYHFIPLACAEFDDSLPFSGASSIPRDLSYSLFNNKITFWRYNFFTRIPKQALQYRPKGQKEHRSTEEKMEGPTLF